MTSQPIPSSLNEGFTASSRSNGGIYRKNTPYQAPFSGNRREGGWLVLTDYETCKIKYLLIVNQRSYVEACIQRPQQLRPIIVFMAWLVESCRSVDAILFFLVWLRNAQLLHLRIPTQTQIRSDTAAWDAMSGQWSCMDLYGSKLSVWQRRNRRWDETPIWDWGTSVRFDAWERSASVRNDSCPRKHPWLLSSSLRN